MSNEQACWNWGRTKYVVPSEVASLVAIKVEYHREWLVTLKSGEQMQVGDDLGMQLRVRLEQTDKIQALALSALHTDGAHHKQWYLYQIAQLVGCDVSHLNEGIAP